MTTSQSFILLMVCIAAVSCDRAGIKKCVRPGKTYCVKANVSGKCLDPCCTPDTCRTLMDYATHRNFSTNDSTFVFSPGDHQLNRVIITKRISNLSLFGHQRKDSVIRCNISSYDAGLYFKEVTNLTIENLTLFGCSDSYGKYSRAIEINTATNVNMKNVVISNTSGFGLRLVNLYGTSTIRDSVVQNSSGNFTQNLALYCYDDSDHDVRSVSHVLIANSIFQFGKHIANAYPPPANEDKHRYASGVLILIKCKRRMNITLSKVNITKNMVQHYSSGGNMAIEYISFNTTLWPTQISLIDCRITHGRGNIGGGLYFNAFRLPGGKYDDNFTLGGVPETNISQDSIVPILTVKRTLFLENESHFGAGVYIRFRETEWPMVAKISFVSCQFKKQQLMENKNVEHGGVAVHVRNFQLPVYVPHHRPLLQIEFINCNFTDNLRTSSGSELSSQYALESHNGALYIQGIDNVTLSGCRIINNNCTGIVAIQSLLWLSGNNSIHNNTGVRGGGMVLCSRSIIFLHNGTLLNITENRAKEFGGGIYVESECDQDIPHCFFQVNTTATHQNITRVRLIDNTAALAGQAIYGGMVDSCIIYMNITQSYIHDQASKIFRNVFHIEPQVTSVISSNPSSVCFCKNETFNENSCLKNRTIENRPIVPGGRILIYIMLLGQRKSPSPGIVQAYTKCSNAMCKVDNTIWQTEQNTANCTRIVYQITSNREDTNGTLQLAVAGGSFEYNGYKEEKQYTAVIKFNVTKCPLGSRIQPESGKCQSLLNSQQYIIYYLKSYPPNWIGYRSSTPLPKSSQIISHGFCPLGYCREIKHYFKINTSYNSFDQDVQCTHNRTGLLCGKCKQNYSLGFGSSQCLSGCNTTEKYLQYLRVIGLTAVCGVAGILLVVLLTLLNLTVAEGTLNGLIFYANIVQVNVDIFFPSDSHARPWTAFIAWLNLDFGVTVCFYDGMDAYVKTWLQFIFPLYLWMLSGGIVYFSRKSKKIAKLAGKNAVKVLATLFLLSFGKLIRTVIAAGFFTDVKSYDGSVNDSVWLLDANIHYLHGKHIVLFAFACFTGVTALLYALTLTFIQCLRRSPNSRMCGWVQRLKPLLDAYTGPYKDRYHFWTGLLLLIRFTLLTAFAVNFKNNPNVNFTLIIIVCALLLIAIQPGIYRNALIGFLESLMYINLILFSAVMMFMLGKFTTYRTVMAHIFGVSILVKFLIIVSYHVYKEWIGVGSCHSRLRHKRNNRVMVQPVVVRRLHSNSSSDEETNNANEASNVTWRDADYREPLIVNT